MMSKRKASLPEQLGNSARLSHLIAGVIRPAASSPFMAVSFEMLLVGVESLQAQVLSSSVTSGMQSSKHVAYLFLRADVAV